jgi:hypothetical protein
MKIVITTIICALLLVFIGCSNEQAPTEVPQVPSVDLVKDQPEGSGATVIRFDGWIAVNYYDVDRDLQVIIGVDMNEYCAGDFNPDIVEIQEVTNPVDQNIVNQLIHGSDIYCWVYPLYPFDCERFLTEGPIASGYVDLVSNDNDLYAWIEEASGNNRVNAFGIAARGELFTPEGQKVRLAFQTRLVWEGYPDGGTIHAHTDIVMATRP